MSWRPYPTIVPICGAGRKQSKPTIPTPGVALTDPRKRHECQRRRKGNCRSPVRMSSSRLLGRWLTSSNRQPCGTWIPPRVLYLATHPVAVELFRTNPTNHALFFENGSARQSEREGRGGQAHPVGGHEQKAPGHERGSHGFSASAFRAQKCPHRDTEKDHQCCDSEEAMFREEAGELGVGRDVLTIVAAKAAAHAWTNTEDRIVPPNAQVRRGKIPPAG